MKSFKLERGSSTKHDIAQGGIFLIILSIPIGLLWDVLGGVVLALIGIVFALGRKIRLIKNKANLKFSLNIITN